MGYRLAGLRSMTPRARVTPAQAGWGALPGPAGDSAESALSPSPSHGRKVTVPVAHRDERAALTFRATLEGRLAVPQKCW
jgi:hypothetical protein